MKPLLVATLLVVVGSTAAFANTVDMKFIQAGGPNAAGEYTYPYQFTVDGVPANLMCISLDNSITNGETWQADRETVASLWGTPDALKYDEAAWLFLQEASHGNDPAINWAAWTIFAPGADLSSVSGGQDWYNQALGQSFTKGEFANVYVYFPKDGTQSWAGVTPQTFLGATPTPEPGTLVMLGSGVLGIAGLLRRKLA